MINFDLFEKSLGIVSPPHFVSTSFPEQSLFCLLPRPKRCVGDEVDFVYDFARDMFLLMLCSIN